MSSRWLLLEQLAGAALDGKKYRAAGFKTFEDYCRGRWDMSRPYAYNLIDAARLAEIVSANADTQPQSEGQLRPLAPLRDDPEQAAEAWAGFKTFEVYCRGRWDISRKRAYDLTAAAEVARSLSPMGDIEPQSEAQLRPLAPFKGEPEKVAQAWAEAVEAAQAEGRDQPTAKLKKHGLALGFAAPDRRHRPPMVGHRPVSFLSSLCSTDRPGAGELDCVPVRR